MDHSGGMSVPTNVELLLPEMRAYARSICQHEGAADDLVQDAVERFLKSTTAPATLSDLRPWMFRVIRNLNFDELRKRRVRREYSAAVKRHSSSGATVPDHARDVLIRIEYDKLPPEKRELLFLVDIMGLTYAEAADVMDVPDGTVMSRLSRARQTLRAMVEIETLANISRKTGMRDR